MVVITIQTFNFLKSINCSRDHNEKIFRLPAWSVTTTLALKPSECSRHR